MNKVIKAFATKIRRRNKKFNGLYIYKLSAENPRRKNSVGHRSHGLIVNGMRYEEFIKMGGRNMDLKWDLKHGYVELSDKQRDCKNKQQEFEDVSN
jgi:hypothetical protein